LPEGSSLMSASLKAGQAGSDTRKPGELAAKLGMPQPPIPYTDGVINEAFAESTGGSACPGDSTATDDDQAKKLRLGRVRSADAACLEAVPAVKTASDLKSMLLGANEEEVMSLSTLGFEGMPVGPGESSFGPGLMMLSKVNIGATPQYRLHFCMTSSGASLTGDETWGQRVRGCCCCFGIKSSMRGGYSATHEQQMVFASLPLEGSLFHVQSVTKDRAKLVSRFELEQEKEERRSCCRTCCSACCAFSCTLGCAWPCEPCCKCVCPAWAPCCWKMVDSAPCCIRGPQPAGGSWANSAEQRDDIPGSDKVAKESVDKVIYKFPGMGEHTCPTETAIVTSSLHRIQLVYHNTGTNARQQCTAAISSSESVESIAAFVSELSTHVTVNPEPPKAKAWSAPSMQSMDPSKGGVLGSVRWCACWQKA